LSFVDPSGFWGGGAFQEGHPGRIDNSSGLAWDFAHYAISFDYYYDYSQFYNDDGTGTDTSTGTDTGTDTARTTPTRSTENDDCSKPGHCRSIRPDFPTEIDDGGGGGGGTGTGTGTGTAGGFSGSRTLQGGGGNDNLGSSHAIDYAIGATRDLSISQEERAASRIGNRDVFWESRLRRGDPLARIALDILHNQGLGIIANALTLSGIFRSGSNATLTEVGIALMQAHVEAVDDDIARHEGLVDGSLSVRQIRDYHHDVFRALEIPTNAYGGTPWPINRLDGRLDQIYCGSCDPLGGGTQ